MTDTGQSGATDRRHRREVARLAVGGVLIAIAIACGVMAVVTGNEKWLLMLALIPLAGMLQWNEDCPRCGRSLRPAVMVDGQEVCFRHCGREARNG